MAAGRYRPAYSVAIIDCILRMVQHEQHSSYGLVLEAIKGFVDVLKYLGPGYTLQDYRVELQGTKC